jgi:hypothetical protein
MSVPGILFLSAVLMTTQSPAAPEPDQTNCVPEVRLQLSPAPVSICLNRFNPLTPDSCVEVTIGGDELSGVSLHFTRTDTTGWRYSGSTSPDSDKQSSLLRIEITGDEQGDLLRAIVYPDNRNTPINIAAIENDRPALPDTLSQFNLHYERHARRCRQPQPREIVETRVYIYPPNYRRDPDFNCAERAMFHSGMSVRMPTSASLENRAQLYIYWHVQKLAPLKFDEPKELVKGEAIRNRFARPKKSKPEKEKKHFLRFKPLY